MNVYQMLSTVFIFSQLFNLVLPSLNNSISFSLQIKTEASHFFQYLNTFFLNINKPSED